MWVWGKSMYLRMHIRCTTSTSLAGARAWSRQARCARAEEVARGGWVRGGGEGFMSLKILPNRPIAHIRAWTPNFVGLGLPPELFFKGLHEDTAACCTAVGHANAIVR